jgi:L-ascorbate metabolism protein UlaG (beta-lactamase superfamily)
MLGFRTECTGTIFIWLLQVQSSMAISPRRRFGTLTATPLFGGAGALLGARGTRYHHGPISDRFDGLRFHDPHGAPPKSTLDLWRWRRSRRPAAWPDWLPSPYADHPPARVDGRNLRVSYVGHASVLVQAGERNILIDPVWSARASPFAFVGPKRVNDPGIAFDHLPSIDTVLVSHGHYDHLDATTLSRLAAEHRPRLVVPLGNDAIIRSFDPAIAVEAYDWHQTVMLAPEVRVTLVPLRHWSARGLRDRNKSLWAGFVIDTPAGRVYHVSDSSYGDGYRFREARERYGPFRLAIIPIGAYEPRWFMADQHMDPHEAVQAFLDCGAEFALAHHHGTFQLTDEPIEAPAQALAAVRQTAGISADRFRVLQPGEVWEL